MTNSAAPISRFGSITIGLALACALSACAVHQPLSLDSVAAPGNGARSDAVRLAVSDAPDASRRFGEALAEAFAQAGLARSDDATLVADYGLAFAPASTAILEKPRESADGAALRTVASPRKGSPLDKCTAQRMKATLSLIDHASGIIRYRGEATAIDCAFTDEEERTMAAALVSDAMAQLGL